MEQVMSEMCRIEDISYSKAESKLIARTENSLRFEVDNLAEVGDYIDALTGHVFRIVASVIRPGKHLLGE
jgi:hypothetical protein